MPSNSSYKFAAAIGMHLLYLQRKCFMGTNAKFSAALGEQCAKFRGNLQRTEGDFFRLPLTLSLPEKMKVLQTR